MGWEDGGPTARGTYVVDVEPPVLTVTPASPPVYSENVVDVVDAGALVANDPGGRAWRKDETIDVTVTSTSSDIDAGSVVLTAGYGAESVLSVTGAPTACTPPSGATYCGVFKVDLSRVSMNAFAGEVTMRATAADTRGNAMTVPATGGVRVTRWQWARRVDAAIGSLKASPAIAKDGTIYLGVATSSRGLVSVSSEGVVLAATGDGPIEGSPAIGRNEAGAERVYYMAGTAGGTLETVGPGQPCVSEGDAAPQASLTVLDDGLSSVMGVGIQGGDGGMQIVGLRGVTCWRSQPGLANVLFPGNLVSSGNAVLWGDQKGKVRRADFVGGDPGSAFVVSGASQSPAGIGTMHGLLLFDGGGGLGIAGGGGGGPGIGKLFAFPATLGSGLWLAPDGTSTPTSGPIQIFGGIVAILMDDSVDAPRVVRVMPVDGLVSGLTPVLSGLRFEGTQAPTPVAGEGQLLYVVGTDGSVGVLPQAFSFVTTPLWTAGLPVGIRGGAVSASPTIDCNRRKTTSKTGVLYFATEAGWLVSYLVDSRGLDTTAPWPKYGHDVRNTGNVGVAIEACP